MRGKDKNASRLVIRRNGSFSKRDQRHGSGEADLDAGAASEQLAAGFDQRLCVEIDRDPIAQEVVDVIREVLAAKRRRCTAHHLCEAGVAAAQMKAISALARECEHLESEPEEWNRRAGDQRTRAAPQHL